MTTTHHPRSSGEAISDEQIRKLFLDSGGYLANGTANDRIVKFARSLLALAPPAAPSVTAEAVAASDDVQDTMAVSSVERAAATSYAIGKLFERAGYSDDTEVVEAVRVLLAQRAGTGGDAKDAARYRTLRIYGAIVEWGYAGPWKYGDAVDAAIDAAMGGETK